MFRFSSPKRKHAIQYDVIKMLPEQKFGVSSPTRRHAAEFQRKKPKRKAAKKGVNTKSEREWLYIWQQLYYYHISTEPKS